MTKCKLCLINEADDTGSHVVPHFLLKRIFNVANAKGRDQEISFKLSDFDVETHFGRGVQPEKLEEVFGELTDEELEEKAMADLVVDHEWCKTCEKKFADLESFYSQTLNTYKGTPYQSTKLSLASLIFWLSIIWRGSVTETTNFRLSDKDQRKLRNLINDYQPGKPEDAYLKNHEAVLSEISYKLFRSADYAKQVAPDRGSFFFPSRQRQPYSFIVDEFVVLLYMRKVYLKGIQPTFFGFEKIPTPLNNYEEGEMICPLSVADFTGHMDSLVNFFKELKLHWYDSKLNKLYHKIGHKGDMPAHIRDEILARVTDDETKLGRKYTYDDFAKCCQEVLLKHHHELRRIDRKRR